MNKISDFFATKTKFVNFFDKKSNFFNAVFSKYSTQSSLVLKKHLALKNIKEEIVIKEAVPHLFPSPTEKKLENKIVNSAAQLQTKYGTLDEKELLERAQLLFPIRQDEDPTPYVEMLKEFRLRSLKK